MCQTVAIAAVIISAYFPLLAQATLSPADGALVLAVKSSRQASSTAPYELRLLSGTQISVSPADVDGTATELVRSLMAKQSRQAVRPAHLFVLRIQRFTELTKTDIEATLLSGATVQLATGDVRDPRLTFLRTAIAEAANLQQQVPLPRPEMPVDSRYARIVISQIHLKWQPIGPGGTAILRVVVRRDGRISDIAVEKSGGGVVDEAAIRAVRAVGQLPPFPAGMRQGEMTLHITFDAAR